MKQQVISLLVLITILIPSFLFLLPASGDEYEIVKDGLFAWYDGVDNTENGHDASSTTWYDIAGDNDVTVDNNDSNYFTDNAYHLKGTQYNFPEAVMDVINSEEFTVELTLGDLKKIGSTFATFINNSGNDNFSLFWRVSGDFIEFKASSNTRPKITGGFEYFKNSTVAITFKVGGAICMYVDGVLIGETSATKKIGATGDFYFGHKDASKSHEAEYRSMRFYTRALTAKEVINNSRADGTFDESYVPAPDFSSVQQPKTNIIGDICLSSNVTSNDHLRNTLSADVKPANLIFYVNSQLSLTDKSFNNPFSSVDEVIKTIDGGFIPTFYPQDKETAIAIVKLLEGLQIIDANIMSSDPTVVKSAREAYPSIRGIIDYTEKYKDEKVISTAQMLDIRRTTISNLCHIAVIPQVLATRDNVKYLNSRQITTWAMADDSALTEKDATALLVSGVYGIISDKYDFILQTAEKYIEPNALIRTPLIIGHRGIPGKMPENTLEGAIEAYNQGADVVEIDLYITVDGVVVINHDSTTSKYNKQLSVESSSYPMLKQLYYTHNGKKYTMPTLEDFLKEFKGKELMLFLEIKSSKAKIVPEIKRLIEEYDMYGQCAIITFETYNQLNRLKTEYPEMPVGFLESASYSGHTMFPAIQKKIMGYNTTYNPSYSGFNAEYVRYSIMRGVTTWPWTINETASILSYIKMGHAGITTDNCNATGKMAEKLDIDLDVTKQYSDGDVIELNTKKTTYNNTVSDAAVKYVVLEGNDIATIDDNKLTINGTGDITIMAVSSEKFVSLSYNLYSQPISFKATEKIEPTPTPTAAVTSEATITDPVETSPVTTPDISGENDSNNLPIIIGAITGGLVIILVIVVIIIKKKK